MLFRVKTYTAHLPAVTKVLVVSIYIDKIDIVILLINLSFEIIQNNLSAHVQEQGLIQVLQQGLIAEVLLIQVAVMFFYSTITFMSKAA